MFSAWECFSNNELQYELYFLNKYNKFLAGMRIAIFLKMYD